jgi:hypothetical protein
MRKRISPLPFMVFFLLMVLVISACSGTSGEATSTQETIKSPNEAESIQPSPDASSSVNPTEEPTAPSEPSQTSEPIAEASPVVEESTGGESLLIGKTLLEERCTECHDLSRVTSKSKTLEEWRITVERMVNKGSDLDMDEQEMLIKYLADTYP